MEQQALEYVSNTGGYATVDHFVDDFNPVGELLWSRLEQAGLVEVRDGFIFLTEQGKAKLPRELTVRETRRKWSHG